MHRLVKIMTAIGGVAPLLASTGANAATACVTPAEFSSLAQFALPSVIEGARVRCQNTVPAGSFLRASAPAMMARYQQGSAQAWPQAKAVFLKLSQSGKDADLLSAALPDPALQSTLDTVVQGVVVSQLPLDRCLMVDRLVGDLAPLPSRNTADLVALLIETRASKSGGKIGPFTICQN